MGHDYVVFFQIRFQIPKLTELFGCFESEVSQQVHIFIYALHHFDCHFVAIKLWPGELEINLELFYPYLARGGI